MCQHTCHVIEMSLESVRQYSHEIPFEIFTVDDIYTEKELDMLNKAASYDVEGDEAVYTRPFTSASDFINGKAMRPALATMMYERLRPFLPSMYVDREGLVCRFVGACKYVMFATTRAGQQFSIHTDTGCEYDEDARRMSKFTVLTYLNDDFEGGETVFYDSNFKETCRVHAKKGRTLVFDINLFHSGSMVQVGEKRWIGTELVCAFEQ